MRTDEKETYTLFGRTRWMRSSSLRPDETQPCIEERCRTTGDGTHVFAYAFDMEPGSLVDGQPDHLSSDKFWLYLAQRQFPEGTRLRVTVEAVPDDPVVPVVTLDGPVPYGGPGPVHLDGCLDMANVDHQAPDCRTSASTPSGTNGSSS